MSKHLVIIGRAEFIEFPDFLVGEVPAKIDTGAYRSAIHCQNVQVIKKGEKNILKFELLGGHPSCEYSREVEVREFTMARVENSFGVAEERYAVNFRVKIGHKVFTTEFTLADRAMKPYPILLGRKTLNGRFLVDTNHSNINRKELLEKRKIQLPADLEETDK